MQRRQFLSNMAAIGAGELLRARESTAQGAAENAGRIDVHSHFATQSWMENVAATPKGLSGVWRGWTPARSLDYMDRSGVATSLLSLTMPGVWFGDDAAARRLARECNEYGATLVIDHRGKFGLFAMPPLPDIDGSLREIEYAFDVLKADGIAMLTNYKDKWLGDPFFAPLFAELNRRKAVVFTHPTVASCCYSLVPNVAESAIEYGTDTTRAIASLLVSGAAARYKDIRFIFSHAGGTMPFLISRFRDFGEGERGRQAMPMGAEYELRQFYYDTAQASTGAPMAALTRVVPISHIVFGTDCPYSNIEDDVKGLRESSVFTAADLRAIERENALTLLPKRRRS